MGIAELSGWLKQSLGDNKGLPTWFPEPSPRKQPTIQPGVPLPSYQQQPDGGYTVQGLAPGQSAFAPWAPGMGVLKNPQRGPVRFDPTGQYNDNNLPNNPNAFLMMPMAPPQFKQFELMQPIGGPRGR